jgi:hypothetical protein
MTQQQPLRSTPAAQPSKSLKNRAARRRATSTLVDREEPTITTGVPHLGRSIFRDHASCTTCSGRKKVGFAGAGGTLTFTG